MHPPYGTPYQYTMHSFSTHFPAVWPGPQGDSVPDVQLDSWGSVHLSSCHYGSHWAGVGDTEEDWKQTHCGPWQVSQLTEASLTWLLTPTNSAIGLCKPAWHDITVGVIATLYHCLTWDWKIYGYMENKHASLESLCLINLAEKGWFPTRTINRYTFQLITARTHRCNGSIPNSKQNNVWKCDRGAWEHG